MEDKIEVKMKVVFTGESNAGKTTLIHWEVDHKIPSFQSTIGIDFKFKLYQIRNTPAKSLLWDTAGAQRFRTMKVPLYRYSHAVCVCFSLNDRQTFERLPIWMNVLKLNEVECPLFLVGCKADLEHVITAEEIKGYASKEGMTYFETSSMADIGVTDNMQKVMEAAFDYYQANPNVQTKPLNRSSHQPGFCWS